MGGGQLVQMWTSRLTHCFVQNLNLLFQFSLDGLLRPTQQASFPQTELRFSRRCWVQFPGCGSTAHTCNQMQSAVQTETQTQAHCHRVHANLWTGHFNFLDHWKRKCWSARGGAIFREWYSQWFDLCSHTNSNVWHTKMICLDSQLGPQMWPV